MDEAQDVAYCLLPWMGLLRYYSVPVEAKIFIISVSMSSSNVRRGCLKTQNKKDQVNLIK